MKARVSFSLCLLPSPPSLPFPSLPACSRLGARAPCPPLRLPWLSVLGRDEGRSWVLGWEAEQGEEEEGRKGRERGRIC